MKQPQSPVTDNFLNNVFIFYGTIHKDGSLESIQGDLLSLVDVDKDLLIGQKFSELVFWQTDDINVENLKNALKSVQNREFAKVSLKFRVKSRQIKHINLNLSTKKNDDGTTDEIFFCATDITTLIREVDFYKERSEHFLYSAESAGIGLWFWDLVKDEIFSTPKCNEIFDLDPHEIITYKYFLEVLHPDDREETEAKLLESQNLDKEYKVEYRVIRSDGNIQWVAASGKTFFNENGNPISMMGSVRRITDEKMAADELEKLYKLEKQSREAATQANKAKDYFLALVSHELRSPLNSILGWTQILSKKEVDEETFAKAIDTIEHSAKSQAKLIEDLVDSARVTSGKLKLELRPVNLYEVIKKAVSTQQPTAEEKEINLEFTTDNEKIDVFGDFIRLQQIFNNLLSNSIKFTDEKGTINVDIKTNDEFVTVRITDDGQGISEKDLPFIFNAFAQGDNTTTREKNGLGLGLSIAKILTDKHDGSITVDSQGSGQGAEFTVKFPIYYGQEDEVEITEGRNAGNSRNEINLRNIKILVVEDDDDSRNVLELYLEQIGADVITAESVIEALKKLNKPENKFDIIISDLAMPEEDGYSLIKKVRASSDYAQIPAIALSAFTAQRNKEMAFQAGFHQYHTKPFEPDLLAEQIMELVKNKKNEG